MRIYEIDVLDGLGVIECAIADTLDAGRLLKFVEDGKIAIEQQPDSKPSAQVPEGFAAVSDELRKAMTKFPTWPTDPIHALAVLGEEFGELTKAVLQQSYEPHKTSIVEIRKEAIQTAAMALRWAASMSEYQYAPCKQHEQSFLAAMLNQSADQPQEG